MALSLTRRVGQEILLTVDSDLTDAELRRELQAGIQIRLVEVTLGRARIAITAPQCVNVMRAERFTADEFERKRPKRPGWVHKLIGLFW